jgi:tRNA-dihydrouridine synthase A
MHSRSASIAAEPLRLSVAPMMDWTDTHCRNFHRLLAPHARLYTEMVHANAVIHGTATEKGRDKLLGRDDTQHPVALQLGGSEPALLAQAARIGADHGFDEINLNCGCPSDRVQSGCFGAVLMETPARVADCVAAMIAESPVPVTVKCRIGVDDQDPARALPAFLEAIHGAGVRRVTIHARKAWLQGLSPRENREVPPLDYPLALAMKRQFPDLHVSVNGGVTSLDQAVDLLSQGFDGVMIGRAAYHDPGAVLLPADRVLFGAPGPDRTPDEVVARMLPYIEAHLSAGGRLHQVTRHMLGLYAGRPGARAWRRFLSEAASRPGAGPETLLAAAEGVARAA